MANKYADISFIDLTDHTGTRELEDVRSVTYDSDDPSAVVKTMNRRRRGRGFTSGVATYGVNLEVAVPVGPPEVDWLELQRTKEVIDLNYTQGEGAAARRWNLIDGTVGKISEPYNADGETRMTVEIMFLERLPQD